MADEPKSDVERIVDDVLEDPDSPEKGDTGIPQTIDAEPSAPGKDAR